ncbi:MAG: nucleotidyl transferase AbiEii/AbiGii toxin family protein [Deltaproteobacteria bacterium]|nr:nucleotidyl transferase AbiEii/AbiGii toxin family protein [Deltaproteobacteria bacterium]
MSIPARQAVELFHLTFARLLCAGPEKSDFAIKGGCNLRFFFGSVRYSEDLDFDVQRIPVRTLRGKVDKLLDSTALKLLLEARGVSLGDVSAPKQTETVQRWKMALTVKGLAAPLHTKVEFSRRPRFEDARVEPVGGNIVAEHKLQPMLLPHYPVEAALRQKLSALVQRSEVQARDVFDLSVLLARAGGVVEAWRPMRAQVPKAIERALEISYDDYVAQVVAYLSPDQAEDWGSRESWDALQLQVLDALERARTSKP